MRSWWALALVLGLPFSSTPSMAQDSLTADVRCMLTMSAVSGTPAQREAATMGVYYFAGRVKARQPSYNFSTGLKSEVARMHVADFQQALKPCTDQLKATVAALATAQEGLKGVKPLP